MTAISNSPLTPKAMEAYRNLMWEIKYRTEAIERVLKAETGPMRVKIAEEFCYLQLRMICEVIAIACLVIHGSLKPKAKLFRTYKADWIMAELAKLHPQFYPRPLTSTDENEADGTPRWVPKTSGFLTRDELQTLWNRHCGAKLHRGSVKNILEKEGAPEMPKVVEWHGKIIRLLERHTIITPDEEWIFYVVMSEHGTGNVASNLFQLQQRDAYSQT